MPIYIPTGSLKECFLLLLLYFYVKRTKTQIGAFVQLAVLFKVSTVNIFQP